MARTDDIEDLRYLDDLVQTSKSYSRVNLTQSGRDASNVNYGRVWDVAEKGVLYVKIDDDMVSEYSSSLSAGLGSGIDRRSIKRRIMSFCSGMLLVYNGRCNSMCGMPQERHLALAWSPSPTIWQIHPLLLLYANTAIQLFIDSGTIPALIASKINHPEHLVISANVINNPALAWVHYHLGAIHSYLPEQPSPTSPKQDLIRHEGRDPSPSTTPISWRASKLPQWTGPSDFTLPKHPTAPAYRHRWLPLGPGFNLDGTPITMTDWKDHSASWGNWAVVAQEHYSFFENLEHDRLDRYHFGSGNSNNNHNNIDDHHYWDYHYERLSINLIAVWGDDIVENRPVPADDEKWLTVELPKKLGRHVVVEGAAVACHFAFRGQKGLESTDVLERYASYAKEMVC